MNTQSPLWAKGIKFLVDIAGINIDATHGIIRDENDKLLQEGIDYTMHDNRDEGIRTRFYNKDGELVSVVLLSAEDGPTP